jgi:hypothetical protein
MWEWYGGGGGAGAEVCGKIGRKGNHGIGYLNR